MYSGVKTQGAVCCTLFASGFEVLCFQGCSPAYHGCMQLQAVWQIFSDL